MACDAAPQEKKAGCGDTQPAFLYAGPSAFAFRLRRDGPVKLLLDDEIVPPEMNGYGGEQRLRQPRSAKSRRAWLVANARLPVEAGLGRNRGREERDVGRRGIAVRRSSRGAPAEPGIGEPAFNGMTPAPVRPNPQRGTPGFLLEAACRASENVRIGAIATR